MWRDAKNDGAGQNTRQKPHREALCATGSGHGLALVDFRKKMIRRLRQPIVARIA
jgi:hypothetical protein